MGLVCTSFMILRSSKLHTTCEYEGPQVALPAQAQSMPTAESSNRKAQETPDNARPFTAFIKGVDLPQFQNQGRCAVAWLCIAPDGESKSEHVTPRPDFPQGPLLRALVEEVTAIVRALPARSKLHIVADVESFWKAFHAESKWFEGWRRDGFKKKPRHDPKDWEALSEALDAQQIVITAAPPTTPPHVELLSYLKAKAQEAPDPKPPTDPGEAPDVRGVYDDGGEALYRRALERDD